MWTDVSRVEHMWVTLGEAFINCVTQDLGILTPRTGINAQAHICRIGVNFIVKAMFSVLFTFHRFFTIKQLAFLTCCRKFTPMFHILNDQSLSHYIVVQVVHIIWGVSNISATWKKIQSTECQTKTGGCACLYIRCRNKAFRHRIKVRRMKPPDPRLTTNVKKKCWEEGCEILPCPSVPLICFYQPEFLLLLQRYAALRGSWRKMLKRKRSNICKLPSNV